MVKRVERYKIKNCFFTRTPLVYAPEMPVLIVVVTNRKTDKFFKKIVTIETIGTFEYFFYKI